MSFVPRRRVLKQLGALALAGSAGAQAPARRPNILLILADDLGYGELSCYGATHLRTPNLDRLATEGVRFTDYYAATPLCAPTRVSILTGRNALRTSLPLNPNFKDPESGLSPDEVTLPEVLGAAGYATGLVGKWHLGYAPKFRPRRQGFQEYFGFLSGWADYYEHTYREGSKFMYRNEQAEDRPGYMTEVLAAEAKAFLDRHRRGPFYLQLAFNAPHEPLQAPEAWLRRRPGDTKAAMIECLDDGIGQVLAHLRRLGLERNTLIVFQSDNGSPPGGRNGPLGGWKGGLREGGIRVPMIARWPGRIAAGTTTGEPAASFDLFPTFIEAAGAKPPGGVRLDGKDILPLLEGKAKSPHEALFWGHRGQWAARRGRWKLIEEKSGSSALYDLDADLAESTNVAASHPDIARDLATRLSDWKSGLPGAARVQAR